MPKQSHVHKLKQHKFKNGTIAYVCVNNCDYRVERLLALGKVSICWRCGESFQMNTYSTSLVKPHCEKCHIHKGSPVKFDKPVVESVMDGTASRIESELERQMNEIKSPVQMLTEDELL